jgi:hypothetical protein
MLQLLLFYDKAHVNHLTLPYHLLDQLSCDCLLLILGQAPNPDNKLKVSLVCGAHQRWCLWAGLDAAPLSSVMRVQMLFAFEHLEAIGNALAIRTDPEEDYSFHLKLSSVRSPTPCFFVMFS